MPGYRKLGRATNMRISMLNSLVTALFEHGRIETTEARAKEVKKIAEGIIARAVKEVDNVTSVQKKVSRAKLDSKGRKITQTATSKNGNTYNKVEREISTEMVSVDSPSRLQARRIVEKTINKVKDAQGNNLKIINKIFDEIAPKYKGVQGGYTRIYKMGPRRGDATEMALIELIEG